MHQRAPLRLNTLLMKQQFKISSAEFKLVVEQFEATSLYRLFLVLESNLSFYGAVAVASAEFAVMHLLLQLMRVFFRVHGIVIILANVSQTQFPPPATD